MPRKKISPAIQGLVTPEQWGEVRSPKTDEQRETATRVIMALLHSKDPEDKKSLNKLVSLRQTAREQHASTAVYLGAISQCETFKEEYVKWALENPGEHQKLLRDFSPKEVNVEVHNTQDRIVLVPLAPPDEWQKAVENLIIDVEAE